MQVKISFTLNIKKSMTKKKLEKELDDNCPLEISNNDLFEVSTERWDIVEE